MDKKEIIKVSVDWANRNFCASLSDNVPGAIVITAKNIIELKREVEKTLSYRDQSATALTLCQRHPSP